MDKKKGCVFRESSDTFGLSLPVEKCMEGTGLEAYRVSPWKTGHIAYHLPHSDSKEYQVSFKRLYTLLIALLSRKMYGGCEPWPTSHHTCVRVRMR